MDEAEGDYGPAMRALPVQQRRFVLAMTANPFGQQKEWAIAAGYEPARARITASELVHDPRIEAAVFEVSRAYLCTVGPILATAGLLRIARDRKHPKHMRALETLANRVGLHERTEHVMQVTHTDATGAALLERVRRLATDLGLEPAALLGVNEAPRLIEGGVVGADDQDRG